MSSLQGHPWIPRNANIARVAGTAVHSDSAGGKVCVPMRGSPAMQMDLFNDGRHVVLRSATADALARADPAAARIELARLGREFPEDGCLADLATLTDAWAQCSSPPFAAHDELAAARDALERHVVPAARRVAVNGADALLRPLWRDLAHRARTLSFRRDRPDDHAAPWWLRAGDWPSATAAVAQVESWRRIPTTLAWMAQARYGLDGLDATWPLLVELAWLAPPLLGNVIDVLEDDLLTRARSQYERDFDPGADGFAWLPAWLLVHRPALQHVLAMAEPTNLAPPERALRTIVRLLSLERAGRHRELVQTRAELRALHADLFADYLSTR